MRHKCAGFPLFNISDDRLEYDENLIEIERNGDSKIIYSYGTPLSFQMEGTDDGVLNCTFESFSEGEATGRVNYYDIPLYQGKQLSVDTSSESSDRIIVKAGSEIISVDETIPASDYENKTVSISCGRSDTNGGHVYGSGQYIRGDAVKLQAISESGYTFLGWIDDNDALVFISTVYEFIARENQNLIAIFARDTGDATDENNPSEISAEIKTPDGTSSDTIVKLTDTTNILSNGAKVIAAYYLDGKMLDSAVGELAPGGTEVSFSKKVDTGWHLFFLNSDTYAPLCEKITLR